MGKILDFLFGKSPQIFDEKGQVRHKLESKIWQKWEQRYQNSPEYNWRNHTGTRAGASQDKLTKN